ncbi:MAG: carboxypeptidase regulatory-like domain-containing protein [Pseudomonadota bacterium]
MRQPTPEEQLYLELINRARADPQGEVLRLVDVETGIGATDAITNALSFFETDLDHVVMQLANASPREALAWNEALGQSAFNHSQVMVDFDVQSHSLPGEPGLGDRIENAGYTGWRRLAENIFGYAQDPVHGHAAYYIDWGFGPGGIQSPPGHRLTILSGEYREVGIASIEVPDDGRELGPTVNTQHFGDRFGLGAILTGVVIDDGDDDAFYDIGEGLGGVSITATGTGGTFQTTSYDSGGYRLDLPDGTYTVTFAGGGLDGEVVAEVTLAGNTVKLDALAEDAIESGERIVGREETRLDGTDGSDTIIDREGDNFLFGGLGNDRITSGEGADYVEGGEGQDVIKTAGGNDEVLGGLGDDTVLSGLGNDTVWGEGGDDVLKTSEGDDTVIGGSGDDIVFAWRGRDIVTGGPGDDVLRGDFDEDRIEGGPGDDRILGGPDRDVFVFRFGFDEDRILDFNPFLEQLDFTEHGLVQGLDDLSISQVDTSTVILTPEGGRVVLADVEVDRISVSDFIF